eukprot:14460274-Alexandrium_andersonii.AAC.1
MELSQVSRAHSVGLSLWSSRSPPVWSSLVELSAGLSLELSLGPPEALSGALSGVLELSVELAPR